MIRVIKHLLRDSVIYGAANIIQKLTPIVIIPLIIAHLGDEALKLYDLSFIYVYLFSSLIVLGMDSAASVFYFDRKRRQFDPAEVLNYAFLVQVAVGLVYLLLFYPFRYQVARFLFPHNHDMGHYWIIALTIIPGFMLYNYGLSILLWKRRKKDYLFLSILQTVLNIGGVYAAVVLLKGSTEQLFYVLVASMTICGTIAIGLVGRQVFRNPFPINRALVKKLLLFGVPFALTSFFQMVIPSVDRYFLLHFQQDQNLPQYILAVKLASFINMGFAAFLLAFTPYSLNRINQEDAEKEISGIFRLIAIATLTSIPIILLFKDWIIQLFADNTYELSIRLLPLLLFGWVFDLFISFTLLGVYRSQKSFFVLGLFIAGTAIIILLNVVLIPVFGVYGAAAGFLLTKMVSFFIAFFFLRKHFVLDINLLRFTGLFLGAAACCYSFFVLPLYLYIGVLLLLVSVSVWYTTRILNKEQVKSIFSSIGK